MNNNYNNYKIYKMSDQEVRARIENLKNQKKIVEDQINNLIKEKKDIDDINKKTEFNKQRKFLINIVREFLEFYIEDDYILAILYIFSGSLSDIKYYLYPEDRNTLFERKLINKYATFHSIRYDDSLYILSEFINDIKALDKYITKPIKLCNNGYDQKRIPLFI
jgi:hypothetical protein